MCVFVQFLIQERLISMTLDKDNEVALQTMKLLILISKWVFLSCFSKHPPFLLLQQQQQLTSLFSDPLMTCWRLRTTNNSFSLFIHHSALLRPLQGSWSSQGIYMWTALSKNKSKKGVLLPSKTSEFLLSVTNTCNQGLGKLNWHFVGRFQSPQYWALFFCHPRWNEWWGGM